MKILRFLIGRDKEEQDSGEDLQVDVLEESDDNEDESSDSDIDDMEESCIIVEN